MRQELAVIRRWLRSRRLAAIRRRADRWLTDDERFEAAQTVYRMDLVVQCLQHEIPSDLYADVHSRWLAVRRLLDGAS